MSESADIIDIGPRPWESPERITCPKCRRPNRYRTTHHIYPRRHYKDRGDAQIKLCWECHCDLEATIPEGRQPHEFYPMAVIRFLSQ